MAQTVILRGAPQRALARGLIDRAPANAVVTIRAATRSSEQNAKLWALLGDVSRAKPEGRHWTTETWKAAHIGVPTSALTTDARTGRNVNARFAICYVGRFRLGISVTQIGRALSRDHTSILHGSRAVVNRLGDRIPNSPDAVADAIAIFDALEGK